MTLADKLQTVCTSFLPTRTLSPERVADLRTLVEVDVVSDIRPLLVADRYAVRGHVLQGRVADVPWIGVHDKRIDSSPTTGVYVTILFRSDGTGLVLSLQHGTEGRGLGEIETETARLSPQVLLPNATFSRSTIRLRPVGGEIARTSRPGKYETASIVAKEIEAAAISDTVEQDLLDLIRSYAEWSAPILLDDTEPSYQSQDVVESPNNAPAVPPPRTSRRQVRAGSLHPPRNGDQGVIAVQRAKYLCEFSAAHTTFVRPNGHRFMEKHHLIPMQRYFHFERSIDHYLNIFSLCPLCHRRIHHAERAVRREMAGQLFDGRRQVLEEYYGVSREVVTEWYGGQEVVM